MADKTVNTDVPDDFMTEARERVPLAFCAHPTPVATENIQKEDGIVEQLLELVDPIVIANPDESRRAPSIKSYGCDTESEFELSGGEDSDFESLNDIQIGALDSDEEFDRIVKFSAKIIEKTHKNEYAEENQKKQRKKKSQKTPNVREYDDLPPLENLTIECNSNLLEFGFVSKVIDCQVIIVSTCTEVLDFDSYLFDEKGNSIGQVYDIFGQVKTPQYVVRFNSSEEASMMPINMKIYYAPTDEKFSKTPFKGLNLAAANREMIQVLNRKLDHKAAVERVAERNQIAEIDSDVEFSDDEAEKQYRKSKQNTQHNQNPRFDAHRGGRKRDRRGGQKVRFSNNSTENPAPKPYRRDYDTPQPTPAIANTEQPPAVRPPQSTESNPYAEFGCYGGFNGRFGV
ncbi:unnamed protein product [Caenorhabditis brenneri]